jgi:hypothetical protein
MILRPEGTGDEHDFVLEGVYCYITVGKMTVKIDTRTGDPWNPKRGVSVKIWRVDTEDGEPLERLEVEE